MSENEPFLLSFFVRRKLEARRRVQAIFSVASNHVGRLSPAQKCTEPGKILLIMLQLQTIFIASVTSIAL